MNRIGVTASLLLATCLTAGCRSWQQQPGDIREVLSARSKTQDPVRLGLTDGRKLTFKAPTVRGDTVFEGQAIGYHAPLSQVAKVETRQVSGSRTALFVVGLPVAFLGLCLAAWALEE